jgi:hypothetical protein
MSDLNFVIASLKGFDKIQKFDNWQPVLNYWLDAVLQLSLNRLKSSAQSNMRIRFKNPTGALEDNTDINIFSHELPVVSGEVANDFPYSFRREYGFSGMTDSRGRFYQEDPGVFYMGSALVSEYDWIREKFQWAINKALKELASSDDLGGGDDATQ